MNKEVTIPGETGFLVRENQDWKKMILKMKEEDAERIRMGQNARKLVEEKYCIQVTAGKWVQILNGI